MTEPVSTAPKQGSGRFVPGVSPNPSGRPSGSRNKASQLLDAIGEQRAASILETVVTAAQAGDVGAAKLILDRIWPVAKGRLIHLEMPTVAGVADLQVASAAVLDAVTTGNITIDEGRALGVIIEQHRRIVETVELELRLQALEGRSA